MRSNFFDPNKYLYPPVLFFYDLLKVLVTSVLGLALFMSG